MLGSSKKHLIDIDVYQYQTKITLRWMEDYGEVIGEKGGKIMGWYRYKIC